MGFKLLNLCDAVLFLCLLKAGSIRAQCTQPEVDLPIRQSFPDGSTVTFECVPGQRPADLKASRSVTCKGNQWTNLELSCTTQCTQPSFPSRHVILTAEHLSTPSFPDGSTVTFECEIGHRPVDSKASKSVTCQGTQWTNLELSCTRKSCGALADFLHGRYEMTGNLFGDTAKPVCDTGYMLAGKETTRTCRDQGWDGKDPVCEPVKCLTPPAIENGQLADEPLDSYDYLQRVSYTCNAGLNLIGQSTLHCSEDGTFKPDPPKCFDGCPVPTIPNAKRIGGKSPPYKLGNFVEYKCEDGYTMKGEAYIVCRANGWDPEPPSCIAPCPLPKLSEHVTLTEAFRSHKTFPHGSKVTVECISGYEPVDKTVSKTITCEETKWTELILTCKEGSVCDGIRLGKQRHDNNPV